MGSGRDPQAGRWGVTASGTGQLRPHHQVMDEGAALESGRESVDTAACPASLTELAEDRDGRAALRGAGRRDSDPGLPPLRLPQRFHDTFGENPNPLHWAPKDVLAPTSPAEACGAPTLPTWPGGTDRPRGPGSCHDTPMSLCIFAPLLRTPCCPRPQAVHTQSSPHQAPGSVFLTPLSPAHCLPGQVRHHVLRLPLRCRLCVLPALVMPRANRCWCAGCPLAK